MAQFETFNLNENLVTVEKRSMVTSALAFSIGISALATLTGREYETIAEELFDQARQHCNTFSNEEVDDFLHGQKKTTEEQCK